jgi:hypothetical protein
MMDNSLEAQIRELSDAESLEAAQLFVLDLGITPNPALDSLVASDELMAAPQSHLREFAELARLLLLNGAASDDVLEVERSVAGTGRTQFILGGGEIVLLTGLLVTAYHVLVTKGKTKEITRESIETRPDGSIKVEITSEVEYGISARLFALLDKINRS